MSNITRNNQNLQNMILDILQRVEEYKTAESKCNTYKDEIKKSLRCMDTDTIFRNLQLDGMMGVDTVIDNRISKEMILKCMDNSILYMVQTMKNISLFRNTPIYNVQKNAYHKKLSKIEELLTEKDIKVNLNKNMYNVGDDKILNSDIFTIMNDISTDICATYKQISDICEDIINGKVSGDVYYKRISKMQNTTKYTNPLYFYSLKGKDCKKNNIYDIWSELSYILTDTFKDKIMDNVNSIIKTIDVLIKIRDMFYTMDTDDNMSLCALAKICETIYIYNTNIYMTFTFIIKLRFTLYDIGRDIYNICK